MMVLPKSNRKREGVVGASIQTPDTGFLYRFVCNTYGGHVLPVPSRKGHKTKNRTSAEERAAQKEVSDLLIAQTLDPVMVDHGIN